MQVASVSRKVRIDRMQSARLQLMVELLFVRRLVICPADLDILAIVVTEGDTPLLRDVCVKAAAVLYKDVPADKVSARQQHIRNRVSVLEGLGLIVKSKSDKGVRLTVEVKVNSYAPLLINYQFLTLESEQA